MLAGPPNGLGWTNHVEFLSGRWGRYMPKVVKHEAGSILLVAGNSWGREGWSVRTGVKYEGCQAKFVNYCTYEMVTVANI